MFYAVLIKHVKPKVFNRNKLLYNIQTVHKYLQHKSYTHICSVCLEHSDQCSVCLGDDGHCSVFLGDGGHCSVSLRDDGHCSVCLGDGGSLFCLSGR